VIRSRLFIEGSLRWAVNVDVLMLTLNKSLICLKFTTICLKFTTTHLKFTTPLKTLVKWWTTKHLSPLWVDWSGRRLDLSFYCTCNLEVSFLCNIGFSFSRFYSFFGRGVNVSNLSTSKFPKLFFYFSEETITLLNLESRRSIFSKT
jgi:hypothetical protein